MRKLVLISCLLCLALTAGDLLAQTYNANSNLGNGIVNSSGQWASQIGGVGAQANRNTANQLFQQALQHESAGLASLNIGLLSQALTESQQGIKADDQARHLAQTSLQALQTGQTAGHVDLSQYGVTEDQLRELANNSSPLLPTVQSHLGSYGISVDHNAAVAKSPFGEFPLSAGAGDVTSAISKIAGALGYGSDGVGAGVQAALANANAIGNKALADAQAAVDGAKNVAGTAGDANAKDKTPDDSAKKETKANTPDLVADKKFTLGNEGSISTEDDVRAREAAMKKNKAKLLKNFAPSAFADASSNLFMIVHDRYLELDREGGFNHDQKVALNPTHH